MKRLLRNNNDNEQENSLLISEGIKMFNKPVVVNCVDVYLDEPICELKYYRNLLHYMQQMEEHDELTIWVDSEGGYLDSAMAIVDAMLNSEGNIRVIVTGRAYSAASIIALKAPSLMIGNNASFMCHTASYGTNYSKQGDIECLVDYNKRTVEKLCRETYKNFLTNDEIELMLLGKDYRFDAEETRERLEKRAELQKAADDAAKEESMKVDTAQTPKSKAKRTTKVPTDV